MLFRAFWRVLALCALCWAVGSHADGEIWRLPSRPGAEVSVFWLPATSPAFANVVLFPGGGGGFGRVVNGLPDSENFLVRIAAPLAQAGLNVAIFGRASDHGALDYPDRVTDWHLADIHQVLAAVRQRAPGPLWLMGTSRGTVSAAAAAIQEGAAIDGLVLTSSVVGDKPGALPGQALARIRVPTLLMHHQQDACTVCQPERVPALLPALSQAPVKALWWIDGGGPPSGNICGPLHWHGFIGQAAELARRLAGWMRQPRATP